MTRVRALMFSVLAGLTVAGGVLATRDTDPLRRIRTGRRFVEARVTAFDYTPSLTLRSAASSALVDDKLLAELRAELEEDRSAANLHRLALAELAVGKARIARDHLEEASRLRPDDAGILSDLAAVEISLDRVAEAAEISGRALDLDPRHAAAAFNWALALERLFIRPVAITAWERFLDLDPGSGWAGEARQHLARLREPREKYEVARKLLTPASDAATIERVVRRFPQRSRGYAQNFVLPRWIETGDRADLRLIRSIAEVRATLGDPYLRDIVEHAATHRDALARPISEFAAARAHEDRLEWDAASARFAQAAELLARAGSPMAIGAEIYAAQGEYTSGRSEEALVRLQRVDERLRATGNRYPVMAAESAWVRALMVGRLGKPQESLDGYRYALTQAERGGEIEHMAALVSLVAFVLDTVGDPAEADQYRLQALRRNDEIDASDERLYTSYLDASYVALRAGRPHLALAFVDAMELLARKDGLPAHLAQTEAWRALGQLELGRRDAARESLADARAHALRVPVEAWRNHTLAYIDFTTARLEMPARPDRAVVHFTSAIDIWERYEWRFHVASGLLARGEAELAMNDAAAAERDFRAGVAEMEKQRSTLDQPTVRVAYFERADRLFDRLIELLLSQNRAEDALSIVERKRARFLLDRIAAREGAPVVPLDASAIAAAIPRNAAVLEITLLDRGAEIWVVHNGQIAHARSTATRRQIENMTKRHLAAITSEDSITLHETGRWLYDQLLAPAVSARPGIADLIIVAEGDLQSFPFATLVTTAGSYLIDAYVLAGAPSATTFLRNAVQTRGNGVLAVAQPAPVGFDALPSVGPEAEAIARQYKGARARVGREITPDDFLAAAAKAAVVHFGGHAKADVDQPAASSLIFESTDATTAARLTAERIGRSTFASRPLVVLAACSTAKGKLRRTEGMDSLAAAFLQAGARGVTGTLWDIDDSASTRLFRLFHEELQKGVRPADALRNAQRALLHSKDRRDRSPSVWGSVTLTGTL